MLSENLLSQIRLVAMQHPTVVGIVVQLLEASNTTYDEQLKSTALGKLFNRQSYQGVAKMFTYWKQENAALTSKEIAAALTAARFCQEAARKELSVELVWTGPSSNVSLMRRTDQAILQVVRGATHELTIICYAVYNIPELVEELNQAIGRGVTIYIIVETPESSAGKVSFGVSALGKELRQKAKMFIWPLEKRPVNAEGKHGSLHVKGVVADRETLFISSANLTEYALTLNMEMGLLIHNRALANQVLAHLEHLMIDGVLIPLSI